MTPAELAKTKDQMSDLFDRADAAEITIAAFRIGGREYKGPPNSILLGISDDRSGCLICRAAQRGDPEALTLLAKIPRLRVKVATSEQLAVKDPERKLEARFWKKMRRACGDIISPDQYLEIYVKLQEAMKASCEAGYIGQLLLEELLSRGYRGKDLRKVAMFISKALETGDA